jgi:DNA-binding transcriptional LysR family regulator
MQRLTGVAVALLPAIDCQPAIHHKQLARVQPGWSIPEGLIHLVFTSRRSMLPGVRVVIDFLVATLRATIESK